MKVSRLSQTEIEVDLSALEILGAIHQAMVALGGQIATWDIHRLYAECSFEKPSTSIVKAMVTHRRLATFHVAFQGAAPKSVEVGERFLDAIAGAEFQRTESTAAPGNHLERLRRAALKPLSTTEFRAYVGIAGAAHDFLTKYESQFLADVRVSRSVEFDPSRDAGKKAVDHAWTGIALMAWGALGLVAVFSAISFNWIPSHTAWFSLPALMVVTGAYWFWRNLSGARRFSRDQVGWNTLSAPFVEAVRERQVDQENLSRHQAEVNRNAAWESHYADIVRRWRDGAPGLMTEHFERLGVAERDAIGSMERLRALVDQVYGGPFIRERLLSEGLYEDILSDDLLAALGPKLRTSLFRYIDQKIADEATREREEELQQKLAIAQAKNAALELLVVGGAGYLLGQKRRKHD